MAVWHWDLGLGTLTISHWETEAASIKILTRSQHFTTDIVGMEMLGESEGGRERDVNQLLLEKTEI